MTTEATNVEQNPLEALEIEAKTDIGLRREENQDSFGVIESPHFKICVVADGMGGVRGGAIASNLAVDIIRESLEGLSEISPTAVAEAVTKANNSIFEKGSKDPGLNGMGTTVVMLTFVGRKMYIANVGDSRAYRIRDGALEQLTEDHTLVNELVRAGTITEDQASTHPVSHMLTRSLGPTPAIEVDSYESYEAPAPGDIYLLCSDGLYNMVHPEEFVEVVQSLPLHEVPAELISLANLRGGADNITIIVTKIGENYPQPERAASPSDEETDEPSTDQDQQDPAGRESNLKGGLGHEIPAGTLNGSQGTGSSSSLHSSEELAAAISEDQMEAAAVAQEHTQRAARTNSHKWVLRYGIAIVALSAAATVSYVAGRMHREPPRTVVRNEVPIVVAPEIASEVSSMASEQIAEVSSASASSIEVVASSQPVDASSSKDEVSLSSAVAVTSLAASSIPPAEVPPASQNLVEAQSSSLAVSSQASLSSEPVVVAAESVAVDPRRVSLNKRIADLEEKLSAFDRPISGRLAESLGKSLTKISELEQTQGKLTTKLQAATTGLSKWLGIKRRLEEQNAVDLAGEIAGLSPVVKTQQEKFQRATWEYLQQYEAWQKSNNSPDLDSKMQQLAKGRNDAMASLVSSIKEVVEEEIAKADKDVGDTTFSRDSVASEVRSLREEVGFARTLVGTDQQAKDLLKSELKLNLTKAQMELKALDILGFDTASSRAP